MPFNSKYNCPECDGYCETACCECGEVGDCPHCNGTGWNPEQVDVAGFKAAEEAILQKMRDANCCMLTNEWIDRQTGERLGRSGGEYYGKVAVNDFLLKE